MNDRMMYDMFTFVRTYSSITPKQFNSLTEAAQLETTDRLLDKVFESMIAKYSKVDFGDIPATKGEIVKFKYYDQMNQCINTIVSIADSIKEFPEAYVLRQALNNMLQLTPLFKEAYARKNSYGIILYNTMALALFEGTSAIISAMIDFTQSGDSYEIVILKYKGSSQMALLKSLIKFNEAVEDGSIIQYLKQTLNPPVMNESIAITSYVIGAGLIWAGCKIIPSLLKELIYLFYFTRNKISDAAEIQAKFLETNIEILKNRNNPNDIKVITKQAKAVSFFRTISKKLAIKNDVAQKHAENEMSGEHLVTADDILI